jgi:hypothetical protein
MDVWNERKGYVRKTDKIFLDERSSNLDTTRSDGP